MLNHIFEILPIFAKFLVFFFDEKNFETSFDWLGLSFGFDFLIIYIF